jgi:hypothetical protein
MAMVQAMAMQGAGNWLIYCRLPSTGLLIGGTEHHSGEVAEGSAFATFLRSLDFRLLQQNLPQADVTLAATGASGRRQ